MGADNSQAPGRENTSLQKQAFLPLVLSQVGKGFMDFFLVAPLTLWWSFPSGSLLLQTQLFRWSSLWDSLCWKPGSSLAAVEGESEVGSAHIEFSRSCSGASFSLLFCVDFCFLFQKECFLSIPFSCCSSQLCTSLGSAVAKLSLQVSSCQPCPISWLHFLFLCATLLLKLIQSGCLSDKWEVRGARSILLVKQAQ